MILQALLSTGFAILVSLIWSHAGCLKLTRAEEYAGIAEGYLGRRLPTVLLRLLGATELLLAVVILMPSSRWWAASVSALVLSVYALVMWRQINRQHIAMRCGCGGFGTDTRVSTALVARNMVLVMAMIYLMLPVNIAVDRVFLTGAAMGMVLYVCYLAIDQLIANGQRMRGLV